MTSDRVRFKIINEKKKNQKLNYSVLAAVIEIN